MKTFDGSDKRNHNPDCSYILNHPCRFLIVGGSVSRKTYPL